MSAVEQEAHNERLTRLYAEQLQGMRDGLLAVNRNVLLYIAEGRERGKQIDACAVELNAIKFVGVIIVGVSVVLVVCVIALMIKVF